MFLKYSLIGLGSTTVVGVGGYAVYHEISKNNLNKDAKKQYGNNITVQNNRAITSPTIDPNVQVPSQPTKTSVPK